MKNSTIILIAVGVYLVIMAAGGAAYYAVSKQAAVMAQQAAEAGPVEKDDSKEVKKKDKKAKTDREKKKSAEKERRDMISQLKDSMTSVDRNGVSYYIYPAPEHPQSGVFLRPFIQEGEGTCVLKNDVFYYSDVEDASYGWIHADHLQINADGWEMQMEFDPSARRDKLGNGAESVTEHFVTDAGPEALEILKSVGDAENVALYFYQSGAGGVSHEMSREEIRHVHDMVMLYELMKQEEKGE